MVRNALLKRSFLSLCLTSLKSIPNLSLRQPHSGTSSSISDLPSYSFTYHFFLFWFTTLFIHNSLSFTLGLKPTLHVSQILSPLVSLLLSGLPSWTMPGPLILLSYSVFLLIFSNFSFVCRAQDKKIYRIVSYRTLHWLLQKIYYCPKSLNLKCPTKHNYNKISSRYFIRFNLCSLVCGRVCGTLYRRSPPPWSCRRWFDE